MKLFGLNKNGYGINSNGFGSYLNSSAYNWQDTDAEAYYNALYAANGDQDIDSQSLYSISLNTLKTAIDDYVVYQKTEGIWDTYVYCFLFIGGSTACHAIDAKTATSVLTFEGDPIQNNHGTVLNGLDQYCNMNNSPLSQAGSIDWSISIYGSITGDFLSMGSADSPDNAAWLSYNASGIGTCNANSIAIDINSLSFDNPITLSRFSRFLVTLYADGVNEGENTNSSGINNIPSASPFLIGAWNEFDDPQDFTEGSIHASAFASSWTIEQAGAYSSSTKTLNATLGR